MSGESMAADAIEVVVDGMFTTHHTFQTESGVLGEMSVPAFRRDATFHSAEGAELTIRSTSWLGGRYEMRSGEEVLAASHPRGAFRQAIDIEFGDSLYSAVPAGAFRQGWYLVDAVETQLLKFQPRGAFRRGAYLEILAPVRLELIVLFYYLVYQRKQEEAAAASASASS